MMTEVSNSNNVPKNNVPKNIFADAMADIEALGFTVADCPGGNSVPYGLVGGRSNQRWWLIPLENPKVTTSGMALFQPVVTSAKLLKGAAVAASTLGLSSLWARKKVYISGETCLTDIFGENKLTYAFFTGTDSPHRKAAVQIMDRNGKLKGFAKVSHNPAIKPLLVHEAETLNHLRTLELKTALVPNVLFCGASGGADMLVTDTLKTARSRTLTELNGAHTAFLRELAEKTAAPGTDGTDWFLAGLRKQYEAVAARLSTEWQRRLEKTLEVLTGWNWGPRSLSHGDFTPWNTFFVDDRLYVFDWEYAQRNYPHGCDLIHFLFSLPERKRQAVDETIGQIRKALREITDTGGKTTADLLFLGYLSVHALHYMGREREMSNRVHTWDGEQEQASFIDGLLLHI